MHLYRFNIQGYLNLYIFYFGYTNKIVKHGNILVFVECKHGDMIPRSTTEVKSDIFIVAAFRLPA